MEESNLKLGPPIYVESLMNLSEYREMSRKYSTYCTHSPRDLSKFDEHEFKWRYGMGKVVPIAERNIIRLRLLDILNKAGISRSFWTVPS